MKALVLFLVVVVVFFVVPFLIARFIAFGMREDG